MILPPEPMVIEGVLYRADALVAEYVRARLGGDPFQNYRALGLVREGVLIGGVVWHAWTAWGCEIAIATDDARWCRPAVLRRLFVFTFNHLGRKRATARTRVDARNVRRLLVRLGCRLEGRHPLDYDGQHDSVSYGMTAADCPWLGDEA